MLSTRLPLIAGNPGTTTRGREAESSDAVMGLMPDGVVTMPKPKLANAVTLGRLPMLVPEWGGYTKTIFPG